MPKTLINEIDNTGSASASVLTNTVYIPGGMVSSIHVVKDDEDVTCTFKRFVKATSSSEYTEVAEEELLPRLLTKKSDLGALTSDAIPDILAEYEGSYTIEPQESGESPTTQTVTEHRPVMAVEGMSYKLAEALLNNGCFVLFGIVSPAGDTEALWTSKFTKLQDRGLFDVKFLCLGEYAESLTCKISDIIDCAEKRGDCIALIDHPRDLSSVEIASSEPNTYSYKVHKWVTNNVKNSSQVNSSFAATFSPWCSNSMYNTGTKSSPVYPMLPPSFSFLLTYSQSIQSNPNWLSSAGAFRGVVPGLVKTEYRYGEQDIDNLQCRVTSFSGATESFAEGDNVGVACNPICNIEPFGVIIWGNRTSINNTAEEGLKATSFLNVRNLACDVKKTMWKAARRYTFEQNTLRLWLNFCAQVSPLLDQAKVGEGISSYKFVREETSAKARLKAKVIIVPIEAVEDFELSFVLEDTIETEESAG